MSKTEEIWSSLLEEKGDLTDEEVFSNVEELRPGDETILTEAEFEKCATALSEGFTGAQLHAYIEEHRQPLSQPTHFRWERQRLPWVPEGPEVESVGGNANANANSKAAKLPDADQEARKAKKNRAQAVALMMRGYAHARMTSKERLAVQLMRECWGISIRELMDVPGWLDVTVHRLEFALLVAGAETWLRDIATTFSTVTVTVATTDRSRSRSRSRGQTRQHRHIELVPEENLLRVFAPAATADAILADIDRVLGQAVTKRFSLAEVAGDNVVGPKALQALGALTGTWIRAGSSHRGKKVDAEKEAEAEEAEEEAEEAEEKPAKKTKGGRKKDQVVVSWIATGSQNEALEDMGDRVYRLLLAAYGPSKAPFKAALDYQPLKRTMARFLDEFDTNRDKWMWADRQGKWARVLEPSLEDADETRKRPSVEIPSADSLPFEFIAPQAKDSPDSLDSPKWYELTHTSTVATFGRVLHQQEKWSNNLLSGPKTVSRPPRLQKLKRILSPVSPPLFGIRLPEEAEKSKGEGEGEQKDSVSSAPAISTSTTLLLRFLPRPGTDLAGCAPPLQVLLDVPDAARQQPPVLRSVHAVMATHVCDVLFPTQRVDARITQQRFFALPAADMVGEQAVPETAAAMAPLLAFLEQSQLSHLGQGLVTPLRLPGLGLPTRVLLPVGQGAKLRKDAEGQHEIRPIDYVFGGLEVRRCTTTAFGGWTLAFTNVDGGRGGGRRSELTLEAVPAGESGVDLSSADANEAKTSFREAVGRLVHGDAIQWQIPQRELLNMIV